MVKVAFCCPTRDRPHQAFLDSLERSVPLLDAAGFDHAAVFEVGCPYISGAMATMLRKAMVWGADVYVFLDDDVSWEPEDLVKLIQTEGDVVSGTYRFKTDETIYMGHIITGPHGKPMVREDGCIEAWRVPSGFLKVTRAAIDKFMDAYPDYTIYFDRDGFRSPDLFSHGAHKGVWYGQDYAFCRNWKDIGGEIWLIPDLSLTHNGKDKAYPGNLHKALLAEPKTKIQEVS